MPVAKLLTRGSFSDMKSVEGNDSLGTSIRQSVAKEPIFPLSTTGDNPVQWIQLLHALDQPDLLGWPLTTLKVQMQKCEKCSQEFCSPINYRRHIRVHRRSLNVNKEFHKSRALLAAFWDKLSPEEAEEVVSFNGVMLKEFPGSAVIKALASSLCEPAVWTLPQVYVRAGSSLLDIIQAKPSRLLKSSQELFDILDAASERTFLCADAPDSVQKYLFNGEAAKACLELKNLIASVSFFLEQQLVKAWVADKDAEALRCQKLLVEEEEAAKKRLAGLSERKKQKKLRQKEHKLKEQFHGYKADNGITDQPVLVEALGPSSPSDSSSNSIDGSPDLDSSSDPQSQNPDKDIDFGNECTSNEDTLTIEPQMGVGLVNGSQPWPEKDETESRAGCLESSSLLGGINHNWEVIIGSISIPVNSCGTKPHGSKLCERCIMPSLSPYDGFDGNGLQGIEPFPSIAAKEFLAQRWKEAVSEEHVQLALA